MDLTFL